jgi:hypothetical protein
MFAELLYAWKACGGISSGGLPNFFHYRDKFVNWPTDQIYAHYVASYSSVGHI